MDVTNGLAALEEARGDREQLEIKLSEKEKRFWNERRQTKRLTSKVMVLKEDNKQLKVEAKMAEKARRAEAAKEAERYMHTLHQLEELKRCLDISKGKTTAMKKQIHALSAQCKRAPQVLQKAISKARHQPRILGLTRQGSYTPEARAIVRYVVNSGCSREQVGPLIQRIGKFLGISIGKRMSRHTVGRIALEGGIAAKVQLGYEMSKAKSLTISADGTSLRSLAYDSRHITYRAPEYAAGELNPRDSATPKQRLLGVHSTVDQSSEASKNGWIKHLSEVGTTYNDSPLAEKEGRKFTMHRFAQILRAMNGDHASKEKSTATSMGEWKKETILIGLGDDAEVDHLTAADLIQYLVSWNEKKIVAAGGIDAWNALSPEAQAEHDRILINEIKMDLGRQAYDALPADEKRKIDLFLWAGCCMHKDQNSCLGGNIDMMAYWDLFGLTPPILLANKQNAATICKILQPDRGSSPLNEAELMAITTTTRGGAKTVAIAGAIFNNKDWKKGKGDEHVFHFTHLVGKKFHRFPDTSNTRFGSHGEAAAELLVHLEDYLDYLKLIKDKKRSSTWTNIELNLYNALNDIPTLTELTVLTLYSQAVTHPYMREVRGSGKNVLDLGDFHVKLRDYIQGIIDNPTDLLLCDPQSLKTAALDGEPWKRPEAVEAALNLAPKLPHLKPLLVSFFQGASKTWVRFTAEFAPGSLIDGCTPEERQQAWMPATNDVNEGALGAFRIQMHKTPRMTAHQYNSQAMFKHNETQSFMDATFSAMDHVYIMRKAREVDTSGLEAKRREEHVAYDRSIELIDGVDKINALRVVDIDDQLDLLRELKADLDMPLKSKRGKKPDKQEHLRKAYEQYVASVPPPWATKLVLEESGDDEAM